MFIQTGGTIDKNYPIADTNHGYSFEIGDPSYLTILERVNPDFTYSSKSVLQKDSLDMTDEDRATIHKAIENIKEDRIVITHGTDTIHITAATLADIKDKTIVLIGSSVPEKFYDSDAEFNLGMAVAAAQNFAPGVYIALYGNVVSWEKFVNK